jgi:20S proteasome subunit beta 4
MECLFGITGPGFCILAADSTVTRSIVIMKPGEDKFKALTTTSAMAYSGEPGDSINYAEYVQRNLKLEAIRSGLEPNVNNCAAFSRRALADALRSRTPWNVNVLIGGIDGDSGRGKLFWMDYLASMVSVPFGAQGYGAYFCSGLLDSLYRDNMSETEAMELLKKCLLELKVRFVVSLPEFHVKIIRSTGIESAVLTV